MSAVLKVFNWNSLISILLGVTAAFVVLAILKHRFPLVSDDRSAFLMLSGAGFLLCSVGLSLAGGQRGFSWLHPMTIIATVTGAAALILAGIVLFNQPLPFGLSLRQTSLLMTGIIFFKWILTYIHQIILK
jgi:hypothetical protein